MHIQITREDGVDPYPAALEALGHVFTFAEVNKAMSEGEYEILNAIRKATAKIVKERDPASLHLVEPGS